MTDLIQPTRDITINIGGETSEQMVNDVIMPAIRDAITSNDIVLDNYSTLSALDYLTQADKQRCVHILDGSCRSDIELFCYGTARPEYIAGIRTTGWIDISQTPDDPDEKQIVDDAIWWCEMRGLFTRHPEHKHLVRFK